MPTPETAAETAATSRAASPAAAAFRARYGRWAVVTGASDGIGRATADELASLGMNLLLVARRQPVLEALAAQWRHRHGVDCSVVAADLAQPEGRREVERASRDLDVGLLVAAAGVGTSGEFCHGAIEREREMLAVNCAAVLDQAWHFGRRFASRGRGGLVLFSSVLAFQGAAKAAHYAATKAWVQCFAEGLHGELRRHGVDVLAAAPGPVATGFGARADLRMGRMLDSDTVARATLAALGRGAGVRPGWLSKLLGGSLATLPRAARVQVIGRIVAGMTAHQATRGNPGA